MLELLLNHLSSLDTVSLSPPLLLFLKKTLNCEHTISSFLQLGNYCLLSTIAIPSYPLSTAGEIFSAT